MDLRPAACSARRRLRRSAQGAAKSAQLQLAKRADRLKPGQWVSAPKIAPKGPILVYVDLDRQVATVYRNGIRIGVTTISSGKPGYDTPTGVFTILEKKSSTIREVQQCLDALSAAADQIRRRASAGGLPGYPKATAASICRSPSRGCCTRRCRGAGR